MTDVTVIVIAITAVLVVSSGRTDEQTGVAARAQRPARGRESGQFRKSHSPRAARANGLSSFDVG
ncbi:hypothetical protein [Pandoraea sp. NPDC087047]|uniref:hypothetical protein n=1 Tax=Pandoraea sp. NPDC087047 TaxID=3364390 RepID=UPI00380A0190